jgi:hypothetical protein
MSDAAGFRDVEVELVARDLEIASFEETWNMMTAGAPPIQVIFDRVGSAGQDRIRGQLQRIVRKRFAGGPIRLTNVATLGSGTAA